jgi:hypothetical protein
MAIMGNRGTRCGGSIAADGGDPALPRVLSRAAAWMSPVLALPIVLLASGT